jgi:4-hydroxybenzoate polyprenyltransferase
MMSWGKGLGITLRPIVSMVTIPWTMAMAVYAASLYGDYTDMLTDPSFWGTMSLVILASWLGVTAGYAVNDYYDFEVDVANEQRVDKAANHGISRRNLLSYAAVLGLPSLLIWLFLSPLAFAMAIVQLVCILAYSSWAKPRTAMSNLLVVIPTALMPITVFFVYTDTLSMEAVLLASVNLVFEPGFTWAGVCRDVEGDRARGVPTLPAVYGLGTAAGIILACYVAVGALTLNFWYHTELGAIFLIGAMFAAFWLIGNAAGFAKDPRPEVGGALFLRSILWFWVFSIALMLDVAFNIQM